MNGVALSVAIGNRTMAKTRIVKKRRKPMKHDPFGNLRDWGPVLDILDELTNSGRLAEYQHGLIRILRYKGNWRLREEVLKCIGQIPAPSRELIRQVLDIVADDNTYYEARILANNAVMEWTEKGLRISFDPADPQMRDVIEKLRFLLDTPHPPFFSNALSRCLQSLTGDLSYRRQNLGEPAQHNIPA